MARVYHMQRVELYKKLVGSTWETTAIVLDDATKIEVKKGIGKIKDTFQFRLSNANNRLTQQFFSGDDVLTEFTIPSFFVPPSSFLGTDKFKVFLENSEGDFVLLTNGLDYSLTGTTLNFVTAPADGVDNIKIEYTVVNTDDKIDIYIWQDDEWADMDSSAKEIAFQMEGTINEPAYIAAAGRMWTCKGVGFIEAVFAALAFVKPITKQKWFTIVQLMIAQINQFIPEDKRIYGQDSTEWGELGNPILDSTGGAFPDKQFSSSYKRGIEILEEVTQDKYTNDGQYIYNIQRIDIGGGVIKYGLIVRYKDPNVGSGNSIVQGTAVLNMKGKRSTDDVINAIIYNCGFDPYERGMEYLNYNPVSQSGLGSKWRYVTTTSHLGQTLLNIEFEADTTKWETTPNGTRKENFPKDASYSYTFQFEGRTDAGLLTGSDATANSDGAFADAIRLEAKWRGNEETDRIITLFSNPRYKITTVEYQTNTAILGGAYYVTIPSFGLYDQHPLRLIETKSTFWDTELTFKEDETVASL